MLYHAENKNLPVIADFLVVISGKKQKNKNKW